MGEGPRKDSDKEDPENHSDPDRLDGEFAPEIEEVAGGAGEGDEGHGGGEERDDGVAEEGDEGGEEEGGEDGEFGGQQ